MQTIKVPAVGLGTFKAKDKDELVNAIHTALDCGYRLIDTAAVYKNEEFVGEAIATSKYDRKDIFITTKIWNDVSTYDEAIQAFNESLEKLQTDYVDLLLIHWPKGKKRDAEVYRAMEDLLEQGKVRVIGVSNFMIYHLDDLLESARIVPMMNQVELHPYLQQYPLQEYCTDKNIALTSYGPFASGNIFNDEVLQEIANKHNVTPSQVVVKWGVQRGIFMIPKSVSPDRIKTNFELNFTLDKEDMTKIRKLNSATRYYPSPDNIDF